MSDRLPSSEARRAHEDETTAELLARHVEVQLALPYGAGGVVGAVRLPGPAIPDDDVTAAVLTVRDDALERLVLDRVVLDMDGEAPDLRVEGRPRGTAQLTRTPSISSRKS